MVVSNSMHSSESPESGAGRHQKTEERPHSLYSHLHDPARGKSRGPTHTPQAPTYIHAENICFLPHIHTGTHKHRHTHLHTFHWWTSSSRMKSEVQAPFIWQVWNTESHRKWLQTELSEILHLLGIHCPAWVLYVHPHQQDRIIGGIS